MLQTIIFGYMAIISYLEVAAWPSGKHIRLVTYRLLTALVQTLSGPLSKKLNIHCL
jgi:hypothetical protein